nr:MAG: hypothetical protein 1 [Leviviridae sp.]
MVRRGYDFPLEESSVVGIPSIGTSPWCHPITSNLINPGTINMGQVDYVEKTIVRKWFRGAFTYYVPPADSLRNAMAVASIQARKVLGISLTPDTVWNLTPWSWAIDWFSNSGDLLSNWTDWAIDNQVLLYGYIMEHTLRERTYTFVGETGFLPSNLRPTDVTLVVETKKRRQASPYGFGLDWEDLTPRQQAIVAALGISRSR